MAEIQVNDKRKTNGNNGTRRGPDVKERKRRTGYYVLKEEVKAGLRARMELVIEHYGGPAKLAHAIKVHPQKVYEWQKRGMISAEGARLIHVAYKRHGCKGFRASFVRFDLSFDSNGKPLTLRCEKRQYLEVVK